MRRHVIGILAVALFAGAAAFWIWPPANGYEALQSACWRAGALAAAVWLSYDEIQRLPGWFLAVLPVLLVFVLVFRKWFLVLIPLALALAILRPRVSKREGSAKQ
jgi:hypothetical protein